jgi:hypothetical protein
MHYKIKTTSPPVPLSNRQILIYDKLKMTWHHRRKRDSHLSLSSMPPENRKTDIQHSLVVFTIGSCVNSPLLLCFWHFQIEKTGTCCENEWSTTLWQQQHDLLGAFSPRTCQIAFHRRIGQSNRESYVIWPSSLLIADENTATVVRENQDLLEMRGGGGVNCFTVRTSGVGGA